jgi:hypothetical protein
MSLHISITRPSAELDQSPIDKAITSLAAHAAAEKRSARLPKGPELDITFMLPGKYEVPPFHGMRMGGYSQENQTLFFETAVPEHITHSEEAPRYVAVVLQDVIDNAQAFFQEHGIRFEADHWRRALANAVIE